MTGASLLVAVLLLGSNWALPGPSDSIETCKVPIDVLNQLKNDIVKASKGGSISTTLSGNYGECGEDLRAIIGTLGRIQQEMINVKKSGIEIDEVKTLQSNFEVAVEKLQKQHDVFMVESEAETRKQVGELQDVVYQLKIECQNLEKEIKEEEEKYWQLYFEFIYSQLLNDKSRSFREALLYVYRLPSDKIGDYFRYGYAKHGAKAVLKSIRWLANFGGGKPKVLEKFVQGLHDHPLNTTSGNQEMVTALLCWTTESSSKDSINVGANKYRQYNVTRAFFGATDDGQSAVDLAGSVLGTMLPEDGCLTPTVRTKLREFTTNGKTEEMEQLRP